MIDDKTKAQAKEMLGELDKKVKLVTFTQEIECMYCHENVELMKDIAGLNNKVSVEVHDFLKSKDIVERYGIDKIPAVAVVTENDYGVRFFGVPSGYEFVSLLEAVKLVSTGDHGLSQSTVDSISKLDKPVHIQVYVTPTCPYCPRSVVLAHRLAYVSEHITGDMVEAIEFPHLANKYGVMGVPRSVINESTYIEGAVPESAYVKQMLTALK
jgi:glutaredoxin-like protein